MRAVMLDTLNKLLGQDVKSEYSEFALDNATEIALNYCNIDEIPQGLQNTIVRMAMDIYRNEQMGSGDTPQVVSGISIGDTSTSYTNISTDYSSSLLKQYKNSLNRYRKLVWS